MAGIEGLASAILEATECLVVVLDRRGRIVFFNRASEALTGYSRDDVLDRPVWDVLVPQRYVASVKQLFADLLAGRLGPGQRYENTWLTRDGRERLIAWSNSTFVDSSGAVTHVIGTGMDVTERHQTEAALRTSNQALKALVSASPMAIMTIDLNGNVRDWNGAAERIFGWTAQEAVGHPIPFVPEEKREESRALVQRVLQGESLTEVQLQRRRKDGSPVHISLSAAPLLDAQGRVSGVMATVADVTERVRAEEALRQSEQLYRDIVALVDVGVTRFDLEGRRTFVNEAIAKRYGVPVEELLRGSIADRKVPEDREKGRLHFRQCIETGMPVMDIASRFVKDGRTHYIRGNLTPIFGADGKVIGVQATSVDITDLMEVQERLRQSEELYRNVLDLTETAIGRFDLQGRRTYANEGLAQRLGIPADKLLGQKLGDVLPPAEAEIAWQAFHRCVETGEPVRGLLQTVKVKGGRDAIVRADYTPLKDSQGAITGVQVTSVDVTELMHAQEALKRSEELYRSLVESIGGIVIRLDREGRRTFVSQPTSRFLGRRWGEVVGGHFGDTIANEQDRREAWMLLEETFRTGKPVRGFMTRQMLHGKLRHVFSNWEPIKDAQGKVVEVQATSFDVTDQVEGQERLRQSEQLYRSLMDAVPVGVTRVDREGRRTFVNAFGARRHGLPVSEVLKGRFGEYMVEGDREKALELLAQVFETGEPVHGFVNRQRVVGGERYFSMSLEPIKDQQGRVVEVQASTVDVTELRQLQDQYLQAQKMESVGRLAGGVAHDFNNLLTAILGYAELGIGALPPDSSVRGYLEEIQRTGERAAQLTRQLLAFSRRQVVQPRVLNLNELITGMDRMLRRLIGEDVEVLVKLAQDLWYVRVDPGLLEQVLVNLAVNSRDAMPMGGRLTIETRNTTLSEQPALPAGEYVVVTVSDNGSGMTDEVKRHAFEPFYTTKTNGTGLGLATCYGIVKQSGGDIQIQSEVGKGTTVVVYLPRVEAPAPAQSSTVEAEEIPRGAETVLLVEDDASVRRLASSLLSRQGYNVLEANSGREALRMLSEEPDSRVHLLLTDVIMPHMSGKELAERVRATRPHLKVLFISGYTDDAVAGHGVLEPGVELLNKPFSAAELAHKVREVLDS